MDLEKRRITRHMADKIGIEGRKKEIIKKLLTKEKASISYLASVLKMPRSSLNHHLFMLEKIGAIRRYREGREVINRVNPKLVQKFRNEFSIEKPKLLIGGYTYDPAKQDEKTFEVLQRAIEILKKEKGIEIKKSIAFATPLAAEKIKETNYKEGDEVIKFDFEVYQERPDIIESNLREIIEKNISSYEILIDLTPLTKIFSIVSLSLAKEYGLKPFYHAGKKLLIF